MNFRKLLGLLLILELSIIIAAIALDGFSLTALQTATRFSGRLSFLFFSLMLLTAHRSDANQFVSGKPYLLFAIVHGIHLIELLCYVYLSQRDLIPVRLLGGFVAYLFIFVMPLLAMQYESGKMRERIFIRFEITFYCYIWFIFFMSYLPRIMGKMPEAGGNFYEHMTLFIWVWLLLVIKLVLSFKVRSARKA